MDSKEHNHETQVKKVDRISPTLIKLTIEMSSEAVSNHEKSTTQAYVREATLPGFRPGKAPASVVKQKFKNEIRRDVISHLLEAGMGQALGSLKLNPLNRPNITLSQVDFDKGGPMEFSAEFEVRPEIELKSYRGVFLKSEDCEPTQSEIQSTLDSLRDRFATLEPLEVDHVEKGQFANAEISYELKGEPKMSQPAKPSTLEVGIGNLLPEIDAALLEIKTGELKSVEATFPENYTEKSHAGRTGVFQIKLLDVKKKVLPELDDEFAKQLKDGGTLASLTEEITQTIRENKKKSVEKSQREEILKQLVEKNPFEVPKSLVERQQQSIIENIQQDMKSQGYPSPKLQPEDYQNVQKRAEHLVRGSLLLHEISMKEKIILDEARIEERISSIAKRFERSLEETKKLLDGKGMTDSVRDEVLTDQVFEFLLKNAVIGK